MSRAGRKTRRIKRITAGPKPSMTVVDFLRRRLTDPDTRSHAEFGAVPEATRLYLAEMRAKQAAGQLVNPDTSGWLLDRLEKAIR